MRGTQGVENAIIAERGITREDLTDADLAEITAETTSRSIAMAFLLGCDRSRYGRLIEDLENNFLQGRNHYPTTVAAAYNLLTNWKQERSGWRAPTAEGVAFANVDEKQSKGPVRNKSNVICHRCDKKGHYANECPERNAATMTDGSTKPQTGAMLLNAAIANGEFNVPTVHFQFVNATNGIACQIGNNGKLPINWILLDNQSTVDVFCNGDLLTNIREDSKSMDIHCNAGVVSTNLIGDLAGYGTVWYHPTGIANILSLSRVKEHGYRVTYDSNGGNNFIVHKPDGTNRIFMESDRGLYFMDANDPGAPEQMSQHEHSPSTIMVNTVAYNKVNYTNRAYSRAVLARNIQKIVGRPSTKEYIQIVERNLLLNCPVTREDIIMCRKDLRTRHRFTKGEDCTPRD